MASLYDRLGDNKRALVDYAQAISLAPTDPDLRVNLAFLLRKLDRASDARADVEAALKIDSKSTFALNAFLLI